MEGGGYLNKEVVPFTAMLGMECATVGINTLFKAATLRGMSYHVFMVYSYAVAALLLLPAPFFSLRSRVVPPLTFSILCKIVLLGLIGGTLQIVGYKGINCSFPTLASAISNLTPAFTFILAIIFRMEKFCFTKASSQAKFLGTIVTLGGAIVVTLYKGPPIIIVSSSPSISLDQPLQSSNSRSITERDTSAWRLRPDIALASILCSGLFASIISNAIHTWGVRVKGPVYVAMFKPLSIVIAVAMGVMFLGDTLHLGSVVGATIISLGFYTLMWGKSKEEMVEDYHLESPPAQRVPLLQSHKNELV
ncbi:hypothetical protein QYF36_026005 [Acer negundo]|nr:hypothetical protein QYF36_026005 [Acer negundo]